ncbi:transcriptional regulator, TetR family [Desulfatibacillum aliphaticivorans]|uniref:Transcriptional regulator, TetR family n=1 Tax=Desulfatibacillum aliphaticivorans TaxID=218208 RepID=B8FND3_DESAL|nr:TetR/AcrR family transcriptional regulator [Desulfatibacillum aliphaticivorans]ACL06102.1 transcriptional regulator, TetR family [Desulfatibacillum aliphaticivorans]
MDKPGKARKPVQKRGMETRAKLMEAAKALFVEKGYYKTNGNEIAAQAGLATGTFYRYFNNKKDILVQLVHQFYQQGLEHALPIMGSVLSGSDDGRKIIHDLLQAHYAFHIEQKEMHKAAFPLMFLEEDIMELSRQEDQKVIDVIAAIFTANKHLLCVEDVQAAAELTYRTCEAITHCLLLQSEHSGKESLMGELEEMLFKYLFTESSTPPS